MAMKVRTSLLPSVFTEATFSTSTFQESIISSVIFTRYGSSESLATCSEEVIGKVGYLGKLTEREVASCEGFFGTCLFSSAKAGVSLYDQPISDISTSKDQSSGSGDIELDVSCPEDRIEQLDTVHEIDAVPHDEAPAPSFQRKPRPPLWQRILACFCICYEADF